MHNRYFIDYQFDDRTKEFHQQRAGHRGMRELVSEEKNALGYQGFGRQALKTAAGRGNNAVAD